MLEVNVLKDLAAGFIIQGKCSLSSSCCEQVGGNLLWGGQKQQVCRGKEIGMN